MALICPYCRTPVDPEEAAKACEGCGTPHHPECYEENGGCTLFGCKFAPPDDPKVQVSAGEVSHAVAAGAAAGFVYAPPASGFGDVDAPPPPPLAGPVVPPPPPPPPLGGDLRAAPAEPQFVTAASTLFAAPQRPPKSRLVFILLGIFLGSLGIHNFYAGYIKRGVAQLCVTVATVFYGSFVTWTWALIEVCTVDRDHNGVSFV